MDAAPPPSLVLLMTIPGLALFYGGTGAHQEHAVGADAGVRDLLADHRAVVRLRLQPRLHGGQRLTSAGFDRLFLSARSTRRQFRWPPRSARHATSPSSCSSRSSARSLRSRCCLIVGAFAERMKFSAVLLFMVLWFTFSVPADRAHGVVLGRPGRVHDDATLKVVTDAPAGCRAMGRARLRRRHGGAHQRRYRRPGRRLRAGQAHRLRPRVDDAAQPDADHGRCRAAVGGLVRLQRRLRRSRRTASPPWRS